MGTPSSSRRAVIAWALYDWANSSFFVVITTFVFAAYFTKAVAVDEATGGAQWGFAMGAAGGVIAVLAPILGAIADAGHRRKPWLAVLTLIGMGASAMLWFATPEPGSVAWALAWAGIGVVAVEMGMVFYNAMLPDIAPPERIGRISGWAWGLGYGGGLVALILCLVGFVQADPPPLGLDRDKLETVRVVGPLVAVWMGVFAWPLFVFVPERRGAAVPAGRAVRQGLGRLWATLKRFPSTPVIPRFLIARMLYTDGLNTLFALGGVYAAGTFGMSVEQVITFGIALQVTAGLGAVGFAWIDDWLGPRRTILIALAAMVALGLPLILVTDPLWFWVLGLGLGTFFGPVQAASRSFMARVVPPGESAEWFGLYAVSGKATAFAGPLLFALATETWDSQRAGMATVLVFLVAGAALLATSTVRR